MRQQQQRLLPLLVVVLLGSLSCCVHVQQQQQQQEQRPLDLFQKYILQHKLHFSSSQERTNHFNNFQQNLQYVRSFPHDQSFRVGLNKFAHLSNEEFRTTYLNKALSTASQQPKRLNRNICPKALPQSVDYRGQTTPVSDQGPVGNSGILATISSIEDGIRVRNGTAPPALSEQNLIDCVSFPSPSDYFEWIEKHNGIDTEASYPTSGQPGPCKFNPNTVGARVPWYQQVIAGNETDLACAVAGVGPTTVCVDASHPSFQFYLGGVYYEPQCTSNVDHCMLAVGYGAMGKDQFWIVKNSWGTGWGLQGYILMARNRNDNCGIASYATAPFAVPV